MRLAPIVALAFAVLAAAANAQDDDLRAARAALRSGDPRAALPLVDKHLAARPQDADGRFLRGVILTELARPDEALAVFRALTQDYPELPEPYNNLAVLYAARGDYERARENLEMAIRVKPDSATAYENLGDVYAQLAAHAYERAAQLDARNRTAPVKLKLARQLTRYTPPARPAAALQ